MSQQTKALETERSSEKFDIKQQMQGKQPFEHPKERASRLQREEANDKVQRLEKLAPLGLMVLVVLCVVGYYLVVTLSGNYGSDDKERAEKILVPVITWLLGYYSATRKKRV